MTQARAIQIQRFLLQRAERRNETFSATLTWFAAEGLALRLGRSAVREQLLLQADLMLHAIVGGEAPYEWDAVLLAKHPMTPSILARNLREVCDVNIDDGLQLELSSAGISELHRTSVANAPPLVLTATLGNMRIPLEVKVVFNDAIGGQPHTHTDFRFRSMLSSDLDARVTTSSLQMALAEALRLIVEGGVTSLYPKHIWNLYQLIQYSKFSDTQVAASIKEIFSMRNTQLPRDIPLALRNDFATQASRTEGWEIYVKRSRIHAPPFEEIIGTLRRTVSPWLKSTLITT